MPDRIWIMLLTNHITTFEREHFCQILTFSRISVQKTEIKPIRHWLSHQLVSSPNEENSVKLLSWELVYKASSEAKQKFQLPQLFPICSTIAAAGRAVRNLFYITALYQPPKPSLRG